MPGRGPDPGTSDWDRFGPTLVDDFVPQAVARIMGALIVGRDARTGSVRFTPDGISQVLS
jgi:hypothetical protein